MGKTLETKKKILELLKKKDMTVTELSEELGLSAATVSQHLDELRSMDAVEKLSNEHFKKLKYYKVKNTVSTSIAKYALGVLVVIVALSSIYLYNINRGASIATTPPINNITTSLPGVVTPSSGGAFACPMLTYTLNGSISSYSGFSAYDLNTGSGIVVDYVMPYNSTGTLYASEKVYNLLKQNVSGLLENRTHYATLTNVNSTLQTPVSGINASISPLKYNAYENETMNLTLTINSAGEAKGTYWLRIDGPCGGGVTPVLITIGNGPYSGNITRSVLPYA